MTLKYTVKLEDNQRSVRDILILKCGASRLLIKRIRLYGSLLLNGQPIRMIDTVKTGDYIEATYISSDLEYNGPVKNDNDIPILYEDEWIVVCSKPANLVTHPTYLHHQNNLTSRLSDKNLHPVSRLDRDTSGLVLIAKNGHAHNRLAKSNIIKHYLGFVHGIPTHLSGFIDKPIDRVPNSIMLRQISDTGKTALTEYKVMEGFNTAQASLIEFTLHTGRTHQIRLHCLSEGIPLIGETLYGCDRLFENWVETSYQKEMRLHKETQQKEKMKDADTWSGAQYKGCYLFDSNLFGDCKDYNIYHLNLKTCFYWNERQPRQALHASYLEFPHPITNQILKIHADLPNDLKTLLKLLRTFS